MFKILALFVVVLVLNSQFIQADETSAVTKGPYQKFKQGEQTITGKECCGVLDTKCCCMDLGGECYNYGISTLFKGNKCSDTKYCGGCERGWKCSE